MTAPLRRLIRTWRARPREAGMASAGLTLVLAAIVVTAVPRPSNPWPTAEARVTTFRDSLVESGTVTAAQLMIYASRITGGPAKIVELAPEGSAVTRGDLLVRFDVTPFAQEHAREAATLRQAEAELARAIEERRLERLQAEADLHQAREQVGYASSALADEADGSGRVALVEAEIAAAEAAREVERARRTHEDLVPMLAEGFITQMELERAAQAWKRAEELSRLATVRLEALQRFGRPAALDRARADVRAAEESATRQGQAVSARLADREAAVRLAEAQVEETRARVRILEERMAATVLRADSPGLVVYRDLFFGSDRRKPQVGDEVWSNQPLIALPDSTRLVVETRVREVDLHKVSASQAVHVSVEAYPDLRLPATVSLVGALAQDDPGRAGTKFFPVTVALDRSDPRLRTGMTARVEIEVASLPSAIVVPRQAVFDRDGTRVCFVLEGGRPARRVVRVVAANGLEAAIEGVAAGEVVVLADPEAGS